MALIFLLLPGSVCITVSQLPPQLYASFPAARACQQICCAHVHKSFAAGIARIAVRRRLRDRLFWSVASDYRFDN